MNYKQDVNWLQIKQDYINGSSVTELSSKYNVAYTTIKSKINNENWGLQQNANSKELQNVEFLTELSKEREKLRKESYDTTILAYEKVNKILNNPEAELTLKDLNSIIKTSSTVYSTSIGSRETEGSQKVNFSINELLSKSPNELEVTLNQIKIVNKSEQKNDSINCEYSVENCSEKEKKDE